MGKNQNTFEKRRREVEKKQRAEEKRKRRLTKKVAGPETLPESDSMVHDNAERPTAGRDL